MPNASGVYIAANTGYKGVCIGYTAETTRILMSLTIECNFSLNVYGDINAGFYTAISHAFKIGNCLTVN